MRIAIDYTTGIYPGAGIARYTRSLVDALARIDPRDRYALFYASRGLPRPTPETENADILFSRHRNLHPVAVPLSVRQMFALWQRLRVPVPLEIFTGRCDVVHSPDFVAPPHLFGADVITVHDVSFLVVPECAEPNLAAFLGKTVPGAVRRARHIIAVSEQTKNDLVRLLNVSPEKITVAYNGVDPAFHRVNDEAARAELRASLGLPERFILHVGTLEPRKNLQRLVEAYGMMRDSAGDDLRDVALVLAGRKGWLYQPILDAVERGRSRGGQVMLLESFSDRELVLLYNMASVFAYPSLYEGFGLPAAEALACGTPTLVSKDGALHEVTGGAALAVDAQSARDIAAGLRRLMEDGDLRAALSKKSPGQVAPFTWEASARTVLRVYREVGGSVGRK